jgi:hypothetical protein
MQRKPFTIAVLVALSVLVLVAAGCGSKKASPPTATSAPAVEAPASTAASTDTTAAASTTASGGSGDCKSFVSAETQIGKDMSAISAAGANSADQLKAATTALNDLANKAPSAIKPDFQTISDYLAKAGDAFNGGKPDISKLQALQSDSAKVTQASTDITNWVQQNCH